MPRFDRVYSLVVGQGGRQGVEITELRIAFEIAKDDSKNPNRSSIRIWNLAPDTRKAMEKPDTRCVLRAGYAEEDGPLEVFQGDVAEAYTTFEGPDVVTTLELGEGIKAIRDTLVSISYGPGANSSKVLRDLAGKMGLSLSLPSDAPVRAWQNGLTFHGAARTALDQVTRGTGLSWSIQNGALQVIRAGGNTNRTVIELAVDSGLLGSPERERKGAQEAEVVVTDKATKQKKRVASATQKQDGWRVRSLLLPTVVPGDRIKLASRTTEGVLTVSKVRHIGDTHEGDWLTEMLLVDPTHSDTDLRAQRPAPITQARQSNAGGTLPPPPPPRPEPPPLVPKGTVTVEILP